MPAGRPTDYRCPIHGEHPKMYVFFEGLSPNAAMNFERRYCMRCVADMFDAHIPQVEPVPDEEGDI